MHYPVASALGNHAHFSTHLSPHLLVSAFLALAVPIEASYLGPVRRLVD